MLQFIFQQSTADTRWLRRRMANELAELLTKTSSGKLFESLTVIRIDINLQKLDIMLIDIQIVDPLQDREIAHAYNLS